jgi:hypothetical protein
MKNISRTTRLFLERDFKGDGIYHTTAAGSQSYVNTPFMTFFNRNKDCVKVLSQGNDAPRGGRTGHYYRVEFTDTFYEKYGEELARIEAEKQAKIDFANSAARSRETMVSYINENAEQLREELARIDHLKEEGEKSLWQVNANKLVQHVSKNDFRALKWIEIYRLVRESLCN